MITNPHYDYKEYTKVELATIKERVEKLDGPKKWKVQWLESQLSTIRLLFQQFSATRQFLSLKDCFEPDFCTLVETLDDNLFTVNINDIDSHLDLLTNSYNAFIKNLRSITQPDNPLNSANDLCHLFFTSLNLNEPLKKVLTSFLRLSNVKMEKTHLTNDLMHIYSTIKNTPSEAKIPIVDYIKSNLIGHFNGLNEIPFDPFIQSNLAHVIYERLICHIDSTVRSVKIIAMGSPTIELDGEVKINPEFQSALSSPLADGKVHFYVNHQNFIMPLLPLLGGSEVQRCLAIHWLPKTFVDRIYAVTLSQNSPFYQTGYAAEQFKNPDRFISRLIDEVFNGDKFVTGNYVPDDVRAKFYQYGVETFLVCKDWEGYPECENEGCLELTFFSTWMAKKIWELLFDKKPELTEKDRRIFIRLFYRHLIQLLVIVLNADTMNESCKDRIDRGAASDAEEFARLAIIHGMENDKRVVELFKTIVFSRALVVRKREIIKERLERLIETVEFMIENKESIRTLQRIILFQSNINSARIVSDYFN